MLTRRVARTMLAGIFVSGGLDAFRNPEARAEKAELVGPEIAKRIGLPEDPETLVRINAGLQVGAGVLLVADKAPRLAAAVLIASLAPTTLAGHPFWIEKDAGVKAQQRTQFLKNVAMGGGLLLAMLDTEGRPSMRWRAAKAARKAQHKLPMGD